MTRPLVGGVPRAASVISDGLGPLPPLVALCGAAARDVPVPVAVGWGLLAMTFAGFLPYALTWRMRHPAHGGRLPGRLRAVYMAIALLTSAAGLAVLWSLGAPGTLLTAMVAAASGLGASVVTNARWGWSNHTAVCGGGAAMLVVLFGSLALWSTLALLAVGWARLALNRHSLVEVLLGAVVGASVSGSVFAALS